MGLLFSRVGTDSFYTGLDKQFKKISANVTSLQEGKARRRKVWNSVRNRFFAAFLSVYICIISYAAYVIQQPHGSYTPLQHAKRVAPAFIAPIIAYTVYSVFDYLHVLLDKRADAQIKKHEVKLKKMIADLKDNTCYERTQQLLEKYDPEYITPPPPGLIPLDHGDVKTPRDRGTNMISHAMASEKKPFLTANKAASVAATAVTGAGVRLSSALSQLWTQAADTLIADDPTLINMLEYAQKQATALERENAELRSMLGYPPSKALNFNSVPIDEGDGNVDEDRGEQNEDDSAGEGKTIEEKKQEEEEKKQEEEEERVVDRTTRRRSRRH